MYKAYEAKKLMTDWKLTETEGRELRHLTCYLHSTMIRMCSKTLNPSNCSLS